MKQIVVISGKGGTGKTTIASSFAYLSKKRNVADCDVEAPNLNLILKGIPQNREKYIGGKKAYIDTEKCTKCGICKEYCRFDAISSDVEVSEVKCEGCGLCSIVCPSAAIKMINDETGDIITSDIPDGVFAHAELNIGADGAGKVVTEVRKAIMENSNDAQFIIIDGSPGIGCVVIASITGCNMAVMVTEPTQSGLSDLKRVLSLADFFKLKSYVIINKYDINYEKSEEIESYCKENNYEIIGKIPFDPYVSRAIKENTPIVEYNESVAGKIIRDIWNTIYSEMRR